MRYPLAALSLVFVYSLADAQTVCVTPNCTNGGTPAACLNRAAPRTPTVLMTSSGVNFVFDPSNPKIEPGDCIIWRAASVTHSSSDNHCTDDPVCGSPAPAACQWDSANVSSASATPTSTCFYDPVTFPAATAENYYCRIHASPTTGTMRGTLQVTSEIKLTVDKNVGTGAVVLTWTGGGVTGDVSYKVARQSGGDPTFPGATTATVNPDGGVLGTTLTEPGELSSPTTRYYLVRNKQTNEP